MTAHVAAFAATVTFVAASARALAHRGKPLLPPHVPAQAATADAIAAAPAPAPAPAPDPTVSQETP